MLQGKFIGVLPQKKQAEFYSNNKEYIYLDIPPELVQCVMHGLFIPVDIEVDDKKLKKFL